MGMQHIVILVIAIAAFATVTLMLDIIPTGCMHAHGPADSTTPAGAPMHDEGETHALPAADAEDTNTHHRWWPDVLRRLWLW